ncbi:MAG: BamA/TamA family outer membrane protein [Flavobacteriales bacterium]|nr:BamA/TamA family outer membrane protein [Flavobacteriales bacterium]
MMGIILLMLFTSCAGSKKIPQGEYLVSSNKVIVNDKLNINPEYDDYIRQHPNKKFLGLVPFKMNLYNAAAEDPQASFEKWEERNKTGVAVLRALFSQKGVDRIDSSYVGYTNVLKSLGEAPVLYDEGLTSRSEKNIGAYYFQRGYFNVDVATSVKYKEDKADVTYNVNTGRQYVIDSINTDIESATLRRLYNRAKSESLIATGDAYSQEALEGEAERLSLYFKQNGVYDFLTDYIKYYVDTNGYKGRAQVLISIKNQERETPQGVMSVPFHTWKVSNINVYTDYKYGSSMQNITDTVLYNGLNIYGEGKIKYKPRVLSDAIFMRQGETFSLDDYTDTYKRLRALRMFSSVNITMNPDSLNPDECVEADIYLVPIKKYSANASFEVSRSSMLGIGTSLNLQLNKYNAFRGGEIWSNTLRATIGSYNAPDGTRDFFNAYEVNLTTSLIFPRFLLPIKKDVIPKDYMPKTTASLGFGLQKNVGLDRNYFSIDWEYSWEASRKIQHKVGLLRFAYLTNTNKLNYFNVFSSEEREIAIEDYVDLHPEYDTDDGSLEWVYDMEQTIYADKEYEKTAPENYRIIADDLFQYTRYTSDFVIPALSYTFTYNSQQDDQSSDFNYLQAEVKLAGNLTRAMAGVFNFPTVEMPTGEKVYELFGVPFSQFAKFNVNYSRHLQLGQNEASVLAWRVYFGLTLPYGNSSVQLPFSEMYFGGGVNYERGWLAYDLGPGSVQGKTNSYNIGNLKLTASLEYRFPVYRSLHAAVFCDIGNVWYTSSKMYSDPRGVFAIDRFYKDLSVTLGLGIRYDFTYFIGRVDVGFKTVDPTLPRADRFCLFRYGISGAALQFALAYPF